MHEPGGKETTSSDGGRTANVLDPQHERSHRDASRFNEWIDPTSDAITDTEVSRLVSEQPKKKLGGGDGGAVGAEDNRKGGFCRISTSSGYSSQQRSPPLSAGEGSFYPGCCTNPAVIPKNSLIVAQQQQPQQQQQQQPLRQSHQRSANEIGPPPRNLAVIHEGETIPRPVWPYMGENFRDEQVAAAAAAAAIDTSLLPYARDASTKPATRDNYTATNVAYEGCFCDYCRSGNESRSHRDADDPTENGTSAKQVLLELSRTLNSVIDASESENGLNAEEILRDISITVARGMSGGHHQPQPNVNDRRPSSIIVCEQDYACRVSSSSSSGAGKESLVGVNPVNLRVYGKPKWLHVPVSSTRSSSQCPYEAKTLLTAVARKASRATLSVNTGNAPAGRVPTVFLVPAAHGNPVYPGSIGGNTGRANGGKFAECKTIATRNDGSGRYEAPANKRTITSPIGRTQGRNGENCNDKCPPGEPVYSTQLDGSDESSSYGAIGESPTGPKNNVWNGSSKVFDPHLDFTLDGNRAERLGRAIAKAKRKRQWCRGLTAILGLVFFVLSVVIVSLSVTRGRKVFGSM